MKLGIGKEFNFLRKIILFIQINFNYYFSTKMSYPAIRMILFQSLEIDLWYIISYDNITSS